MLGDVLNIGHRDTGDTIVHPIRALELGTQVTRAEPRDGLDARKLKGTCEGVVDEKAQAVDDFAGLVELDVFLAVDADPSIVACSRWVLDVSCA